MKKKYLLIIEYEGTAYHGWQMQKNGISVHKVGPPVFAENLAVAFDKNGVKDNARLVKRVSEIIVDMHEDGTLSTFSMKWFKEDRTKNPSI